MQQMGLMDAFSWRRPKKKLSEIFTQGIFVVRDIKIIIVKKKKKLEAPGNPDFTSSDCNDRWTTERINVRMRKLS